MTVWGLGDLALPRGAAVSQPRGSLVLAGSVVVALLLGGWWLRQRRRATREH